MKISSAQPFQFHFGLTMKLLVLIIFNCGLFVSFMPYLNILKLSTLFDSVRQIVNAVASDDNCTEVPSIQVLVSQPEFTFQNDSNRIFISKSCCKVPELAEQNLVNEAVQELAPLNLTGIFANCVKTSLENTENLAKILFLLKENQRADC